MVVCWLCKNMGYWSFLVVLVVARCPWIALDYHIIVTLCLLLHDRPFLFHESFLQESIWSSSRSRTKVISQWLQRCQFSFFFVGSFLSLFCCFLLLRSPKKSGSQFGGTQQKRRDLSSSGMKKGDQ